MKALERVLLWLGIALYRVRLHRCVMWLSRRNPKVLVYHACEESESAYTRGLDSNTSPAVLERHLDFLARHYSIVPLDRLRAAAVPERALAITFDDGYRSVHTNALPLLRKHGMPATVLLVTDVIGNDALVWVNELMFFLNAHAETTRGALSLWPQLPVGGAPAQVMHAAKVHYDPGAIDRVLGRARDAAGIDARAHAASARVYLDWSEVDEMARHGISFGSHTASHPNLARLSSSEQRDELVRAREAVRSRAGTCNAFAYPFGIWNATALESALASGHEVILEVGGDNRTLDVRHVARTPVHATTAAGLFAELEIVGPARALARRVRHKMNAARMRTRPNDAAFPRLSPDTHAPVAARAGNGPA